MRNWSILPVVLSVVAATAPAAATPCKEEISTIERRLDSAGAAQVTGKAPTGGVTSSDSPKALDKAPEGKPSDSGTAPSAGGVGEARALLKTAKSQEASGDERACQDTMTKVKEKAGSLP